MFQKYFALAYYLALQFALANSQCELNSNGIRPYIVKDFGLRKIISHSFVTLELDEDEHMVAFCSAGDSLSLGHNQYNHRSVELMCQNGYIYYKSPGSDQLNSASYHSMPISCGTAIQLQLFESERVLPDCTKYNSLVVGIHQSTLDLKTAGICYDLNTLSLKYITFTVHSPNLDIFIPIFSLNSIDHIGGVLPKFHPKHPDLPVNMNKELKGIQNYFTFMSEPSFQEAIDEKKRQNKLLNLLDFSYKSIVQHIPLHPDGLEVFNNILSIVWWRNLQQGNWQFLLDALVNRGKTVNYIAYMGTSGTLSVPTMPTTSCNSTGEFLNFANNDLTASVKAPEFIWMYLKPLEANQSDEFVVIAHNSPFLKSSNALCTDVCDDIDWLSGTFKMTRLMPSLGVVVCCRAAEVASVLDNFPRSLTEGAGLPSDNPPNSTVLSSSAEYGEY